MSLRLELFVRDIDVSAEFYRRVLGFELVRRDETYASLRSGATTLGLRPAAWLEGEGCRGLGVEIVLEVDDVAAYEERVRRSGHPVSEALCARPWGLTDFRIHDPDGYYLRITSRSCGARPPRGSSYHTPRPS